MDDRRRAAARASLDGLAFGDAFGERFFGLFRPADEARRLIGERTAPPDPHWHWHWTDDTAMALGLFAVLEAHGEVPARPLAERFAADYEADPGRGYGPGMHALLPRVAARPGERETLATALFGGEGSLGNGAAMGSPLLVKSLGALWCAARHPDDLESALWTTAAGLGDVDTTCAIVGGVVAAHTGVSALPQEWRERREPLPPPVG
ncbi:ADP-ribosylglycohydrolase family protein [Streptomyces sp. NPDC101150]|uniref:ADP-ribosylglycohydrolase family protein n=1 Tax=Streptomyces sp. NPDC101150 TaxID=3366114 RepID=UPI00382E3F23